MSMSQKEHIQTMKKNVEEYFGKQGPYWVGIDLDGTLADHVGVLGDIGAPVPAMIIRVKDMLSLGIDVRIVTARAAASVIGHDGELHAVGPSTVEERITQVIDWCVEHIGRVLPVTSMKDPLMRALWDDRSVEVHTDQGLTLRDDAVLVSSFIQQTGIGLPPDIARAMERIQERCSL